MAARKTDAQITAEIERDIKDGSFSRGLRRIRNVNEKPPRAVYSLRLSLEEAEEFEAAAKARGMSLSDFLRSAAHASIKRDEESVIAEVRAKARQLTEAVNRL